MKAKNSYGESVRGFEVHLWRRNKPSVKYPPQEWSKALQSMKVLEKRGFEVIARTDGPAGEEWLKTSELEELFKP